MGKHNYFCIYVYEISLYLYRCDNIFTHIRCLFLCVCIYTIVYMLVWYGTLSADFVDILLRYYLMLNVLFFRQSPKVSAKVD